VTETRQPDKLLAGAGPTGPPADACPPARPGHLFTCSTCGRHWRREDFLRFCKDGRPMAPCRACRSRATIERAKLDGYKKVHAAVKRWRHAHPIEAKAVARDGKRVQRGTLPAGPCEVCGRKVSQNHHESYDGSKPRRLCRRCHNAAHDKRTYASPS